MIRRALLLFLISATMAQAQVNYTGGVYSQDFNGLPGTTNNTLNSTWTDNSTLAGWYANKTTFSVTDGTLGGSATSFDSTSSTANNAGLFSFGSASSSDRSLGSRATSNFPGNSPVLYGVRLVNQTSQTLTRFTVTYTGEQWYASTQSAAHTLLLDYQFAATNLTDGTWNGVTAATFTAPIATGTTARSLNGNTTANRTVKVAVITGVSWAPGQELWIRFRDTNESGNEQGLAVDDFSLLADDETGLFFNGSTSYVTMGFGTASATAFGAQDFTLECRFLRTGPGVTASTGNGGVTALPLIAKGVGEAENTTQDANYFLGIDANGRLCADFEQFNATNNGTAYAAGQNFPVTGSTVLQNGVWYHVAATYHSATAQWKLYVNGIEETGLTMPIPPFVGVIPRYDSIQGLGIGTTLNSQGNRSGYFQGVIDEVRLWNVARTGSQIANQKDVKIVSGEAGMLARFGFDENTGTSAAGTRTDGAATPAGTLSGTSLPQWVNAQFTAPNTPPTVTLTAPVDGFSAMAPTTLTLTATANDSDGSIAKVEFYHGLIKIGEDSTAPYQFDWSLSNSETGSYALTAKALDNGGASATSAVATITITPNSNQSPLISLSSPADGAVGLGSSTQLHVSLSDPEDDAMTVTFYGRPTTPATPGPDFTLATLPDTQFYSENLNNNGRAATFHAQTQWLVDNRSALNLAFVSHMGDIVQNGDAVPAEWTVADGSLRRLENPLTTLLPHGIPWGAAPGNHDQTSIGNAGGANVLFNQWFGTQRFAGRRYWGGSQSLTNNNNNCQFFSASGLDFLIIHFEYDARAKSNYQGIIDWADALVKAHPHRRAIVTSHWIVNTGNPASFSTQGQNLYDELKDNPNFFLMLCGHVHGEGQRSDTFAGRTVHSVLQDYQGRSNGGDGWLRYFTFSPANNSISARTYRVPNPVNAAAGSFETDADSQFTLTYNMQDAVMDWVPLGTTEVSAGSTSASLLWTGLQPGAHYEWRASVTDGINTATSTSRRFSTASNAAPSVAITSPTHPASMTSPASFTLTAEASDSDGSVSRVEFYQGSTKLGEDTTAPFEQPVNALLTGSYDFTAVAVDNGTATTLSSVLNVVVNASQPPTVSLTSPLSTDLLDAPATVNLSATASDADGTVTMVEFFQGAIKLGEDSTAPYTLSWTGVPSGTYSLTAKATDNANTTSTSPAVVITVTNLDNVSPTVLITSPADLTRLSPTVPLTLNASASDSDGLIAKVEFFDGATLLGEDTSTPYSFTIASLSAGAHAFTAKATDNDGASTTSAVVSVTGDPTLWAYAQNFDSMGTTGTSLPSGWSMRLGTTSSSGNAVWTDATGIPTSGVASLAANANALTATTTPSANNNNGFNAAASAGNTADRAVATAPTTYEGMAIQLALVNGSDSALTALRMSYDIIRYSAPSTANELPGYWLFASLDNGTTWTNLSALNPTLTTVPNTTGVTSMTPTSIALSGSWAANATLLLRWVDDNATQSSPDQILGLDNVSITIPIGQPPTVALTAPANGSVAYVGETVTLTATAEDAEGSITRVEFYQGATKLGEDMTAPYSFEWTGFTPGNYSLTARATDQDGNVTTSSAVSLSISAAPGSGTLTRGPYLNQNNATSIVLRWRTSQSVVGRVRYGPSAAELTEVVNETAAATDHVVQLTGLQPYTRYYYSIGSAFDTLAGGDGQHTFRTSPVAGTATDTRIWVVGDCGRGSQFQRDVRDAYYAWTGSRAPDLCLMLGDNAYNSGTDAEYQTGFFNIYDSLFRKMPLWSCLGNHDANNGSTSSTANFPYFDMFTFPTAGECGGVASGTERYFSFDYGNVHVVNLDSQTSSRNTIEIHGSDGPMAAWLRSDLASTTRTWILVIFHHPPYSKGSHDSDSESQMVQMRTHFGPILENGGADLVLVGHSHAYERSMLIDSHYGVSSTLTAAMKKNAGSGRPSSGGAYIKPLTGPRDHFGTVYTVTGSAGSADGGSLNHAAMYVSYNTGGTLNIDILGNRLDATYIEKGATTGTFTTPDSFTILKQGAADSDGDGVADEFEIANGMNRFSNTDALVDTDGDGLNAVAEYLLNLNPATSDRYPWTTTRPPGSQHVEVAFPTLPQRSYRVYYSETLLQWFPASPVITGDGTTKVWTDDGTVTGITPGASPKRFYRVEVLPAP